MGTRFKNLLRFFILFPNDCHEVGLRSEYQWAIVLISVSSPAPGRSSLVSASWPMTVQQIHHMSEMRRNVDHLEKWKYCYHDTNNVGGEEVTRRARAQRGWSPWNSCGWRWACRVRFLVLPTPWPAPADWGPVFCDCLLCSAPSRFLGLSSW